MRVFSQPIKIGKDFSGNRIMTDKCMIASRTLLSRRESSKTDA